MVVLNDKNEIGVEDLEQFKIFKNNLNQNDIEINRKFFISEDEWIDIKPKLRKKDIAKKLGVSRTTLWRMMKEERDNLKYSNI